MTDPQCVTEHNHTVSVEKWREALTARGPARRRTWRYRVWHAWLTFRGWLAARIYPEGDW